MRGRFAPCALAAAALAAASISPVIAQPAPSTSNAVFVGGTPIMRVRVPAGGFSPEQRAAAIQERVNEALSHGPIHASDITVEPSGNEAVVLVKGHLLFTADWATARFNEATPMDLANQWADHMRMVLPNLTAPK
jgi:hypothetical protein